jgi:hypothetical protein
MFAFSSGCDNPFDHDFMNYGWLACVVQFSAGSIKSVADGADCRLIEQADGYEREN